MAQPYLWLVAIRPGPNTIRTGRAARNSRADAGRAASERRPRARIHPEEHSGRRSAGHGRSGHSGLSELCARARGESAIPGAASRLGSAGQTNGGLLAPATVHRTKWLAFV